jgi:uncharacterized protein with HEPN domain
MLLESRKLLWDMQQAARAITSFVAGKAEADYLSDLMFRSAVERQFEIAGEAMARLAKRDIDTAKKVSEYRGIIGFRNQLIHGYDDIEHPISWGIVTTKLPILLAEVDALLATAEAEERTTGAPAPPEPPAPRMT